MFRLCTKFQKNYNLCIIFKINQLKYLNYIENNNYKGYKYFQTIQEINNKLNENNNHESDHKKYDIIDTLINLNYSENNKHTISSKLRFLYHILNNDKNYELTYSSHVSNLLLDIWKSRRFLNTSELSLYDKICYELSEKIWEILPYRNNKLSDSIYYHQFKYDLKILNDKVLSPTPEQYEKKEKLINYLKPLFDSTINGTLYTFGSCDNGLWSRGSDIDLCLLIPNCNSKRYMLSKLNLIKSCLSNSDIISNISIISARVPIVKLYDTDDNNLCDISINNAIALQNSEYVKSMCKLDERVIIMGKFIKYWATCRKINNRAEGTLSSYTLILQLFYYLQNRNPPIIPTLREIEINKNNNTEKDNKEYNNNNNKEYNENNENDNEDNKEYNKDNLETKQNINTEQEEVNIYNYEDQDYLSQEYNYLTNKEDILNKCIYLNKNKEDVIDLLFGFFEFYSDNRFSGGMTCSTIDMYDNIITENNNGTIIVKCPLSKKNVNPFTIKMWQSIYSEFKRANDLIKLKQPLSTICQEVHLSPLELQIQQHKINQQKLLQIFK